MIPLNGGNGFQNAPNLSAQFGNFQQRIAAGNQDGNLTPGEDRVVGREMRHFRRQMRHDEATGMTNQDRQQLWQDASNINGSIYGLRHNDLGSQAGGSAPPALMAPPQFAANLS